MFFYVFFIRKSMFLSSMIFEDDLEDSLLRFEILNDAIQHFHKKEERKKEEKKERKKERNLTKV